MVSKMALWFLCLVAGSLVVQASPVKPHYASGTYTSNAEFGSNYKASPQYDFNYSVKDLSYGGSSFGATESRRSTETTGSYYVDVPGSQSQRVSYVVGGKPGYRPHEAYQQKKYLPKLVKVGYATKNAHFPKPKGVSYTKSVIQHPRPAFKAYSPIPKISYIPKREISYHGFPVSHSNIRNYHTKSHPTSYTKSSYYHPNTAVSYSKSKIYHPKPSYTTVYKAHPIELKVDSEKSGSNEDASEKKGVTISKLPGTKVTYQPILIKTYKPVYEVKYKPVFIRDYSH